MDDANQERPRTSAMGLVTDAKEMLKAAEILHASDVWAVQGPTYFLLGHGIEVALKAFLLANGDSMDLMFKIGHNLAKAARRVVATSGPLAEVVKDYMPAIELLNLSYQAKEFEYRVTGSRSYPSKDVLINFLREIIRIIEPIAYRAYSQGQA